MLTDTARYADIVLPATTEFEHTDLHHSYFHLSLQLNEPAIEPLGESRPNIDTFNSLAKAMGFRDSFFDEELFIELCLLLIFVSYYMTINTHTN